MIKTFLRISNFTHVSHMTIPFTYSPLGNPNNTRCGVQIHDAHKNAFSCSLIWVSPSQVRMWSSLSCFRTQYTFFLHCDVTVHVSLWAVCSTEHTQDKGFLHGLTELQSLGQIYNYFYHCSSKTPLSSSTLRHWNYGFGSQDLTHKMVIYLLLRRVCIFLSCEILRVWGGDIFSANI
jgi:hypothetical protein